MPDKNISALKLCKTQNFIYFECDIKHERSEHTNGISIITNITQSFLTVIFLKFCRITILSIAHRIKTMETSSMEMMEISGIINDFQWVQDRVDREVTGSRRQNITSSNPIGTPAYIIITRPRPAFGQLGLGISSRGNSSHG